MKQHRTGYIETIAGGMFSGKTEELLRRMRKARYGKSPVFLFRPAVDNRYSSDAVGSHAGQKMTAHIIHASSDILPLLADMTAPCVIGIDEAQFLDDGIVDVCQTLAHQGHRVIVAGLDQNYLGEPFGPMPRLLAVSEFVQKLLAVCVVCGDAAGRSQRTVISSEEFLVGETEAYEARCRACHSTTDFTPTPRDA